MILYNRLAFFNKAGNSINFDKVYSVECIVNRNTPETPTSIDAKIEVITNEYGFVEGFEIIQSGKEYTDDTTITISDKFNDIEYVIDVPAYIQKNDEGGIISVSMPQDVYGFSFPSYIYTGEMLFDKVSVNLTEVEQLYIMEEVVNDNSDSITYTAPYSYTDSCGLPCNSLSVGWADSSDDPDYEIGLFNIHYDEGLEYPYLEVSESVTISLKDQNSDNGKVSSSLLRHVNINSSTATTLNVKLWAENEGVYTRDLIIYEEIEGNKYIYALITFTGETEGEDERFKLMLQNFGIEINEEEQKLFRTSSLKEDLPDYSILNAKRKEMLLEYHNIFPYIGSYKSLVNILNYFGYGDCKLKEYWKNVDKTAQISSINKNIQAIDLTSLHMYSRFNRNGNDVIKDLSVKNVEYKKPRFSQDNMDLYDNDVTDMPYISSGVIVGKKLKDVGNLVKPLEISNKTFKINFEAASSKIKDIWYERVLSDVDTYETQYAQIEIPLQLFTKGRDEESIAMLPAGSWVKDNKLALFYPIVEETDEEEDGLPVTKDSFMISEDEAAVKLFALQKYLQKKFMPLGVELFDIVGEGVYFTRMATKTWNDKIDTLNVIREDNFDFDIIAKDNLIKDLQDYGDTEERPSAYDTIASLYDRYPNNFGQKHIEFKNDSGTGVTFNPDKTVFDFGKTGCKINLQVKDIWVTWDEVDCSWDTLKNTNWKELGIRGYTDIWWKIKYKGEDRSFFWETGGVIDSYENVECILPYEGKYAIQCILYDLTATQISKTIEYEVKMPYANFFIFGRNFSKPVNTWDDNSDITWDDVQSEWRHPNLYNDITWDELDGITWNALEYTQYMNQDDPFIKNKSAKILKISEKDRFLGKVLNTTYDSVELQGCYDMPPMKEGEHIFVRNGESVRTEIINSIEYDRINNRTYVSFSNMGDVTPSTEILRELCGTILLNGILSTDTYNELNDGKFLLFRSDSGAYRTNNIKITGINIDRNYGIRSLQLNTPISIVPGEFGIIYERRKVTLSSAEFNSEAKTFTPQIDLKREEIIPGFTIINVTSKLSTGDYNQRLLILKEVKDGSPSLYTTYLVKELDGDMTLMDGATNTAYWDYHQSQVKLSSYETRRIGNEIELNENDYPTTGDMRYNVYAEIGNYEFEKGMIEKKRTQAAVYFSNAIFNYRKIPAGLNDDAINDIIEICGRNISQLLNEKLKKDDIVLENASLDLIDCDWLFDYATKDGSFSVEVEKVGEINGNTLVLLKDTDNELYQASPTFNVSWSSFDEEYAETHYGTDIFKWINLNEISWDNCKHLTWNMTEYFSAPKCGFVITKVSPNGAINFGENHHFQFNTLGTCKTEEEMMIAATKELNESEESFVNKFTYFYYDGKIHATAKFEGASALNYINYSGGVMGEMLDIDIETFKHDSELYEVMKFYKDTNVSHTYPVGDWSTWNDPYKYGKNNKYASWNPVARTYYEYSTNPVTGLPGWYPALNENGKEIIFKENSTSYFKDHFNEKNKNDFNEDIHNNINDLTDGIKDTQFNSLEKSVKWRYEEYYKQFYDYALNSPFSWDDLIGSGKEIRIPLFTTLFFVPTNTVVASKQVSSYQWTLLENDKDKNEIVVSGKDNLIWTFTKPGYYDVMLEVKDINGNKANTYKKGVVIVS